MKSREEFEALVKKKIESKKGIALQNRRAWESVAATAVACFLIFWISYLAVPHLMGNRPVGTGAQTDGDSTESEPTPTYGTETNDTTIAEDTVPIEDRVITKMHVWGHYVDGIPQTLENDFEFDVTDDAAEALWESLLGLTVEPTSLTDSELYAVASWEVEIGFGAVFEDGSSAICRLYQHYLRREYEGAESTWYRVTDPRQTYGIMESIGLSLPMPEQLDIESEEENEYFPKTYHVDTVGTASMLQTYKSYLEIPLLRREEVFDPKGLETYTVTFRYGDGISKVIQFTYEHIGFDDVWYRVDVEQYRRFTDRLGIWFREPHEQITDDEIVNAMTAVGCPAEQLPSIERELTETELTALGRYLAIRDVQNVLSCSPFARPEDIDLCGMLYATDSSALSTGERKALLSLAGSGVVENAAFSRLTTREIEALTEKYLGITFNDALRQRMLNEQSVYCGSVYYLDGYDAYYLPHNDTNLIVPEVLQGWLTEDGSYLIRYREALTGDGHYICLLKPADDGYRIRMMLNLEEALADPKEPSDTTEPPETSESETDPPVDTTKPTQTSEQEPVVTEPPETSESETDPPADTTRPPETSDSETEPIITEPPVDTSGEDDPKDTSEAETEPDVVLELTWDQAILEKADFSDALYQNLNASSLLLSYTYHPILYREDGLDRNGYLRILQFDRVANQFKQMTYLDLVSADGERVTHMLVFGKAQILVSEDEPMYLWIINISVMQSGQGNMTFCRYWISDVLIDSLSGQEIPQQDVSMIVDYSDTRYTQSRVGFNVRRESDMDFNMTTYLNALSEGMNNFRMMQHRGVTYYRIADSLLANAEVWHIADQMPCPDIEIYEDEMTLERVREHYIENIQPYTW